MDTLNKSHVLPAHDTSRRAFTYSKLVILLSVLFSGLCFLAGGLLINRRPALDARFYNTGTTSMSIEVVALALNFVITLLLDGLGFIHSTTLRWSLYRESRLQYNTNMRLLTVAKKSWANGRIMSIFAYLSLTMCYSATALLWFKQVDDAEELLNIMALFALGVGMLVHTAVAAVCLVGQGTKVATWSSNPLNNTLAALQSGETNIHRRDGRAMLSAQDNLVPSGTPSRPKARQGSLWNFRWTKWTLGFVWLLAAIAFLWFGVILGMLRSTGQLYSSEGFRFVWNDYWEDYTLTFGMSHRTSPFAVQHGLKFGLGLQFFFALLFACVPQGLQAIGLHCVEVLVNVSRDEKIWRQASVKGVDSRRLPLITAASNWENCILLILKSGLHWLMGVSLVPHLRTFPEVTFYMSYSRLLVYACACILVAILASYLAFKQPKGPQPAAWGNIQTLADLVDEWPQVNGEGGRRPRLFWGDKGWATGCAGELRRAGTSITRHEVGAIQSDAFYI